jgi:hypothetical protein
MKGEEGSHFKSRKAGRKEGKSEGRQQKIKLTL